MVAPLPAPPPMDPSMIPPGMEMPGAPPPPPAPPALPPPDPDEQVLLMLRTAMENEGEEAVRERLRSLPPQVVNLLWEMADQNPELASLLDQLMPTEPEGPEYAPWFARTGPPPRPSEADVLALAGDDETF